MNIFIIQISEIFTFEYNINHGIIKISATPFIFLK